MDKPNIKIFLCVFVSGLTVFGCNQKRTTQFKFNKAELNCENAQSINDIKTYSSIDHGYSIDLPLGWEHYEEIDSSNHSYSLMAYNPKIKVKDPQELINVNYWHMSDSLDEYFIEDITKIKDKYKGTVIDTGKYENNGITYYWYYCESKDDVMEDLCQLSFYCKKNDNKFYSINFMSTKREEPIQMICPLSELIDSFKFY